MITMIVNAVIIYAALIVMFRLIGKRQLGDLELSELLVMILISELASTPITDPEESLWVGIIPAAVLLGMSYLLSVLAVKNVRFRALLSGKPALLIVHGRIDQTQMKRNRITPEELTEALRSQGILELPTVEYAILEPDGQLNVIPAPEHRPATAGQLGIAVEDTGYPVMVISTGRVLSDNLTLLGRDERWLKKQLDAQGLSDPADVYLMTADMAGGVYVVPKV